MFELERMVEEAVTMDSESTEYLKLKQEVEAFIHFRPDAKVDDFMMRYMELVHHNKFFLLHPVCYCSNLVF